MTGAASEPFRLVLVEDNEGHARLMRKSLQRAGVANPVTHVTTGAAALAELGQNRGPLVVVLDLNLPDIDGFEVLTRLRDDPATRSLPVIVLTTTDHPGDIDRGYQLGCNVFITKPVAYDVFSEAVGRLGLKLTMASTPDMKS